jgi:hypothetical protein
MRSTSWILAEAHSAKEQAQFFERRKGFANVIVGAEFHGLHSGFDGTVAGHHRDFRTRIQFLDLLQKLKPGHRRHHHVGQDQLRRLFFQQSQCGLAVVGLKAGKAQPLPYRHAEFADALLIINDQQANT